MIRFLAAAIVTFTVTQGIANISFMNDMAAAQAEAKKQAKPIFVHFTAPWCEACHEMKKRIYPTPEIQKRLQRFVALEIDVETKAGAALWSTYHLDTLPTLAFLDPHGVELKTHRVVEMQEVEALAAALDRAYSAFSKAAPFADESEAFPGSLVPWMALGTTILLLVLAWLRSRRQPSADA